MAAFHHILFGVTKIINPHLLLSESYQVLWARPFSSDNQNVSGVISNHNATLSIIKYEKTTDNHGDLQQFLYTHTILFAIFIATFILGSIKTLRKADKTNEHRSHLIIALTVVIGFHIIYIFSMNYADAFDPLTWCSSTLFACIYTTLVAFLLGGFQWAQTTIGSIGDSLVAQHCIKHLSNKSVAIRYQFITNLIIDAVSFMAASLSLGEIFITNPAIHNNKLGFSNSTLIITLVVYSAELICLHLFTSSRRPLSGPESKVKPSSKTKKPIEPPVPLFVLPSVPQIVLNFNDDEKIDKKKSFYSLEDTTNQMSPAVLTISAKNMQSSGEESRSTDEDEFNEIDISELRKRQTKLDKTRNVEEAEFYDKNKFSLYEDFEPYAIDSIQWAVSGQEYQLTDNVSKPNAKEINLSPIEILVISDGCSSILKHFILLVLIGCVFQAHQLCYLTDYLLFLIEKSPLYFRSGLPVESSTIVHQQSAFTQGARVFWMELFCVSLLIQTISRITTLHYADSLLSNYGHERIFWTLALISLTVPFQFLLNYTIIVQQTIIISTGFRCIIVLGQLAIVQLQIGLIGALIDFMINDLALKYAQHVMDYRSSKLNGKRDNQNVLCTIHGLLNGAFYLLGGALMSAISLLINFLTLEHCHLTNWIALISITPSSISLALISAAFAYRWKSNE